MLSPLRNRFGIPGVISVIALVFAMFGGAYAASNDGSSGDATASAKKNNKAKKGPRGPRGKTGPAGPAGPQGPAGAAGAKGDKGDKGDTGSQGQQGNAGTNGDDGVSPEGTEFAGSQGPCTADQGGVKFEGAEGAVTYACNGKEGSPWTTGGTLPPTKTLTGVWSFAGGLMTPGEPPTPNSASAVLSFPLPLAAKLTSSKIIYTATSPDPTNCPGTVEKPAAASGYLCIYQAVLFNASFVAKQNVGVSGAELVFLVTADGASGRGSWAVTAP